MVVQYEDEMRGKKQEMVETEQQLRGMEVFKCMSPWVSFRFLQRVLRCGPKGASWAELRSSSSVQLPVCDPPREISVKPIHQARQPKQIADVHARTGRRHMGQTADESSGDIVVFERRVIVGLASRADQRLRK